MSMLPRLKPLALYDLVIEVAIDRPGPIQGQMVHPYLRARQTGEQPSYPTPEIVHVLQKTLGVSYLSRTSDAWLSLQPDSLLVKPINSVEQWRHGDVPRIIDQFRKKLMDGMLAKGLDERFAEMFSLN